MKVQADDKLSADDKAAKIAEIKAELAKIEQMEKQARQRSLSEARRRLHRGGQGRRQGRDEEDDRRIRRRLRQHELTSFGRRAGRDRRATRFP